ncbi:hypothetical protein SFUMM280S_06330 [Streptomyces fumanus]
MCVLIEWVPTGTERRDHGTGTRHGGTGQRPDILIDELYETTNGLRQFVEARLREKGASVAAAAGAAHAGAGGSRCGRGT